MRFNHILCKPVHGFCRLIGLSRKRDTKMGKVWRHEFYRSQLFCSIYIFLTWLDTWIGRIILNWNLRNKQIDFVICDRWINDILIDLAVENNVVKKSGAWFSYNEEKLGQGRENVRDFLAENEDLRAEIEEAVKRELGLVEDEDSIEIPDEVPTELD